MGKIAEMTWQDFGEKINESRWIIIPTGAVECYGPHLPLGTDTLVAERIAELLDSKLDGMIAPTLEFGDSTSMKQFPGTLAAKPESFKCYLQDLLISLIEWGAKKFLFINGHAGNTAIIGQICYDFLAKDETLDFFQIDWWRYATAMDDGIFDNQGYMAHGHASECATSIMLYLYPDMVKRDAVTCSIPKIVNSRRYPNMIKYTNFNKFSDNGSIGDATSATEEKGRMIVERCLQKIVDTVEGKYE